MKCITLREYLEKILPKECEMCKRSVREIIAVLGLKEDDLVYPLIVSCCALTEAGDCEIPLPCPRHPVLRVGYMLFYKAREDGGKEWYKEYCVKNLFTEKEECVVKQVAHEEPVRLKVDYASSIEQAVEILKRFGLDEETAGRLVEKVV